MVSTFDEQTTCALLRLPASSPLAARHDTLASSPRRQAWSRSTRTSSSPSIMTSRLIRGLPGVAGVIVTVNTLPTHSA